MSISRRSGAAQAVDREAAGCTKEGAVAGVDTEGERPARARDARSFAVRAPQAVGWRQLSPVSGQESVAAASAKRQSARNRKSSNVSGGLPWRSYAASRSGGRHSVSAARLPPSHALPCSCARGAGGWPRGRAQASCGRSASWTSTGGRVARRERGIVIGRGGWMKHRWPQSRERHPRGWSSFTPAPEGSGRAIVRRTNTYRDHHGSPVETEDVCPSVARSG